MDREDYYQTFIRYIKPSEDNESVNLAALRHHAYGIFYSYKDRPINEDDIKRDAGIFLMGMKAGRARAVEVEGFRKVTKTISGLLHRVGQA